MSDQGHPPENSQIVFLIPCESLVLLLLSLRCKTAPSLRYMTLPWCGKWCRQKLKWGLNLFKDQKIFATTGTLPFFPLLSPPRFFPFSLSEKQFRGCEPPLLSGNMAHSSSLVYKYLKLMYLKYSRLTTCLS